MSQEVKVFFSPTCPHCKIAKDFLTDQGVAFKAYDVIADKNALEEMRKISGGALRVPVISICNDVIVGFDRERLEMALRCLSKSSKV